MRIRVHVEGIKGSRRVRKDEEPSILFNGVLEVDGVLIEEVSAIETIFAGGDFATVKAHLIPGAFEVVTHTDESWPELLRQVEEQKEFRSGSGVTIATAE